MTGCKTELLHIFLRRSGSSKVWDWLWDSSALYTISVCLDDYYLYMFELHE